MQSIGPLPGPGASPGRARSRPGRRVLADLAVVPEPDGTTLVSGELADQAAVHGLLASIRDLGLSLISVETAPSHRHPQSEAPDVILLALFLVVHASIHIGYICGPAWPFVATDPWLVTLLGANPDTVRSVGIALVLVTLVAFVLAAVAAWGSCGPSGSRSSSSHRWLRRSCSSCSSPRGRCPASRSTPSCSGRRSSRAGARPRSSAVPDTPRPPAGRPYGEGLSRRQFVALALKNVRPALANVNHVRYPSQRTRNR